MKLTKEQCGVVEENEKLVYWYANMNHLNVDDWYGLLAIELCNTVIRYNPHKGSFTNYFKLRCDWMVNKEYRKKYSAKREHITIEYVENMHSKPINNHNFVIETNELFDGDSGEILKMKYNGYTQREIADYLGMSQSYISKILKKAREDYYEID